MLCEAILSGRPEWILKKDKVFHYLFQPNFDIDDEVETILNVILPALSTLLKEHYKDILNGSIPKQETNSVVKHNIFAERVFAYTDHLLKCKPNISHISVEAYTMFCLNKTSEWLNKKDQVEREQLVTLARKEAPKLHSLFMKRKKQIKSKRMENLKQKRDQEEKRKAKQMLEKEMIHREISYFGFYQSKHQLEISLKEIKGTG